MTADARAAARSPLAPRLGELAAPAGSTGGAVTTEHVPFLAQVSLRVDPSLADRAPYPLPSEPNTAWEEGDRAALWLGPDEWLVLGRPFAGPEIVEELEAAFAGGHRSVVDVSASRGAIELGGSGRFDVLATMCSLDLHPRAWGTGACAQTLLGKAQVILHERAGTTGILVRSSIAGYLLDLILSATEH